MRASAGTGAKAPSLYQLYSTFGTPNLQPEQSFGYDGGIDQIAVRWPRDAVGHRLLERLQQPDRFRIRHPASNVTRVSGCYVNVARAETSGLEVGATIDVLPGLVHSTRLHLPARRDLSTGLVLERRPEHLARFTLDHADAAMADRAARV